MHKINLAKKNTKYIFAAQIIDLGQLDQRRP